MRKLSSSLCFLGALTLVAPSVSAAGSRTWSQGENLLEQHLQPGQSLSDYRRMLKDLGYTITTLNYKTPDYVEYEVVKDDRSYEVQMDLDEDTGKATNIDITPNIWQTESTEAALDQPDSAQTEQMASLDDPDYVMVITPVYVATAQDRTKMGRMVQELENLPVGKDRQFYRRTLERQGYQIKDSATKGNRTQLSVKKDDMNALLNVRFDDETGESTQISAFPLLVNVAQSPTQQVEKSPQSRGAGRMVRMVRELESLPVGHGKQFYRNALQQRGYQITDTTTSEDKVQFEVEKKGQRVAVDVMFDDQGKSTDIAANRLGGQESSAQMSSARQSRQDEQFAENN